jgi:hypothetical protein
MMHTSPACDGTWIDPSFTGLATGAWKESLNGGLEIQEAWDDR